MKKLDEYIQNAIESGVFPGISILVGERGRVIYQKNYGYQSLIPVKEVVTENTLYDLASLTKPLITAFSIVYLMEKDVRLTLETDVKHFFPEFPFNMSLLHLLTHTSGLPDWYPFYLYGEDYLSQMFRIKLQSKPGRVVTYSCVGYILLHFIIERVTGASFEEFAREVIIEPLGLKNTFLKVPEERKKFAAATENGNMFEKQLAQKSHGEVAAGFKWREYMIQGETHDCNSWYRGGTAGNAGLFATTADVFGLSLEFFPETAKILKPESLQFFYKNYTPFKAGHRTVGFKRNSSPISSGGRVLSWKAAGHNGFTGTSIWLEPEKELVLILLSNRIHPVVNNDQVNFDKVRRRLHRILMTELDLR